MTEAALLSRCEAIEGLSFAQLANDLRLRIPESPAQRKGWAGMAIELALGGTARNGQGPDFPELGIELKTIPLNANGRPVESTFITSIPLLSVHQETWKNSSCYAKLRRVLWVPVEGDQNLEFAHRRIGKGILWSPSVEDETILSRDWEDLTWLIGSGKLAELDAKRGRYLQVRPKARNAKSLCYGYDEEGNQTLTLPRGFYLRASFTGSILHRD